jgi:CRP-like cAMP-binding protein
MADDEQRVGVERLLFLRSLSLARGGPEAAQIAAAMRDVRFARGERLFEIGAESSEIFFLVKGSARMSAPPESGAAPWDFEAPAVIGALDAFAGRPRTRRAVATSDTHALALAHTDWLAVLEEYVDFARESVLRIAGALHRHRATLPNHGGFPAPDPPRATLATGLGLLERALAARESPLFRAAGVQATLRLVELASEIALRPGEVLFREGASCDAMDLITSGLVAIERRGPPLSASFGPGSLVGGCSLVATARYPFTAIAPEGAVVLRMRKDDLFDVMEDHFSLTRALLRAINAEREQVMREHGAATDSTLGGAVPPR